MNRDPIMWDELVQDLDFLFTFAALPETMTIGEMDADTVKKACRLTRRLWVTDFDACDTSAAPILTKAGKDLLFILNTTEVVKELKDRYE